MILKNHLMICINLNFDRYLSNLTHIFSTYIFILSKPIFLMMNLTFLKLIFIKLNVSVLLRFMFEDLLDYFQIEIRHQKIILFQPYG